MVRRSPQTLITSSPGTTSSGSKAPAAGRTWCSPPRKPLLLRRRTPRLPDQRRRWRAGRGASLPANPYSFVAEHHVFRGQGAGGGPDVVLPAPQTLILSSPGTTSSGSKVPVLAWPDGGIWLRGEPGANMIGREARKRRRCWRGPTEGKGFARSQAPTWSAARRENGAGVGVARRRVKALPGARRQLGRPRAGKTAPVLAWPDGRQRLCEEPGANLAGPGAKKRRRCWRGPTEGKGFAGSQAPTWPAPGRENGADVGVARRRAKALRGARRQLGRPRAGRGAPPPANPYSFVAGHHVFPVQGAGRAPDVVRLPPQTLILSSPSTTSSRSKAPAARRTWCAPSRKPLFFRRRAPRFPGPRRRPHAGRGASLPANPYSFVAGHHVFRGQGASRGPDVVRLSPQTLIPSSPSTTSSGSKAPPASRTWCASPRKPLFLRHRAPRLPGPRCRPPRVAGGGAQI